MEGALRPESTTEDTAGTELLILIDLPCPPCPPWFNSSSVPSVVLLRVSAYGASGMTAR